MRFSTASGLTATAGIMGAMVVLGACAVDTGDALPVEVAAMDQALLGGDSGWALAITSTTRHWKAASLDPSAEGTIHAAVSTVTSYNGGDPVSVRMRNRTARSMEVQLEEEASRDRERSHTHEDIATFIATDPVLRDGDGQIIGAAGRFNHFQNADRRWRHVSFPREIPDAVVFTQMMTFNGADPGTTRVRNVTSQGFDFRIDEWAYRDGAHMLEEIGWVALSQGSHWLMTIEGDMTFPAITGYLRVGTVDASHRFETVSHLAPPGAPWRAQGFPILAQAQTFNGIEPIVTRVRPAQDATGFELRLQEEEGSDVRHSTEQVAFVAFQISPSALTSVGR